MAGVFGGEELLGGGPEGALAGGGVDGNAQVRDPGEDAGNVGVDDRGGQVVGKGVDRARRVAAHAWKGGDFFQVARELAAVLVADGLRGAVEVPGTGVVAQTLPEAEHVFLRGVGEGADRGETLQPAAVIIQDRDDLGLLQHELADHHRVRVARVPPGQVASVPGEPVRQRGLEGGPVFWFLEPQARPRFSCRCHLCTPLPRP